jgi:hypothetical protein
MPEQLRNIHIFCAGILTNLSIIHTDTMVSSQQGQTNTHVDMKANPDLVSERQSNLPLPEQPPVPDQAPSSPASHLEAPSAHPQLATLVALDVRARTVSLAFPTTQYLATRRTTRALSRRLARTQDTRGMQTQARLGSSRCQDLITKCVWDTTCQSHDVMTGGKMVYIGCKSSLIE